MKRSQNTTVRLCRGELKGSILSFPEMETLRPTPQKVRQAVFSMIAPYFDSHAFIDLFSGSGAMAFEAWSCGFDPVGLSENNTLALKAIKEHQQRLGVNFDWVLSDATELIKRVHEGGKGTAQKFLFYVDPPYRDFQMVAQLIRNLIAEEGRSEGSILILEHEQGKTLQELSFLELIKQKKYGRSLISIFLLPTSMKNGSSQ